MDEGKEKENFEILIQSLQLVGSEYRIQIESFPDFVNIPDEIAIIYNDCLLLALQNREEILIDENQMDKIKKIDEFFDNMSESKSEFWNLNALKNSKDWDKVRLMANEVLSSLGIKKQKPDLFWINYTV